MTDPARLDGTLGKRIPLRVLLVDDEAVNVRVMLRLLHRLGYEADSADDGDRAVEAARAQPYDLILLDLHMPRMDGATAARHIRALPATGRRPRVVALTASDGDEAREACTAAGMDDFLVKPVTPAALEAVILRTAGGYRGARRVAPS